MFNIGGGEILALLVIGMTKEVTVTLTASKE